MNRYITWSLLAWLLNVGVAYAQTESTLDPVGTVDSTQSNSEFGGVVTAEVLTSMGHLFHAKFTESWHTLDNVDSFNVFVKERPSRRGSTEVQVIYGDNVVFRRHLPSNYSVIVRMAADASETVRREVVKISFQSQLFRDVDMAPSGY